jgi:tetratricopeptide (TPR) repeat protein
VAAAGGFASIQWRAAVAALAGERAARLKLEAEQARSADLAERRRKVSAFYEEHVLIAARPAGQGVGRDVRLKEALDHASAAIASAFRDAPEDEAQVCQALGDTYLRLSEHARAEALIRRAFALRQELLGEEHRDTLASANNLAGLLLEAGRPADAERLLVRYERVAGRVLGEEHEATLSMRHNRAHAWLASGRPAEAEQLLGAVIATRLRVLGPEHEQTLASQHLRGVALNYCGRVAEARQVFEDVLPRHARVLGEEHPATLFCKHNLAFALLGLREFATADSLIREAIASRARVLGERHGDTLASRALLVGIIASRKQGYPEGEQLCREWLPVAERDLGPGHPTTVNLRENLASIYLLQNKCPEALRVAWRLLEAGRGDDARAVVRRVRTLRDKADGPDPAVDLQVNALAAWAEHRAGNTALAEEQLRACLAAGRERLAPRHWLRGLVEALLGDCLAAQQKYADAEPLVLSGYETLRNAADAPAEQVREAHARVVALYKAWGRPDEAGRWKEQPPPDGQRGR